MSATLTPANEAEIADAVRTALAERRSIEILGRGTKRDYGRPSAADYRLDLSGLTGIVRYEPDELVLTLRAGTPIAEIDALLQETRQRLGFAPADWGPLFGAPAGSATIGGALSADASGSLRLRYGAARDHLLGYRAVNGLGEIYQAGGHVVKNVTGFDLPKLVCGALGTLGALSEVTLRLVPRATSSVTLAIANLGVEEGLAMLRQIWKSPLEPLALAYLPPSAMTACSGLPAEGEGTALIRLEGAVRPLADKIAAIRAFPRTPPVQAVDGGEALFAGIGAGSPFLKRLSDIWRICVPPAAAANVIASLAPSFWCADWAGGLLWLDAPGTDDDMLHACAARAGGYATLFRAAPATRATRAVFPPQTPIAAALTRRVKAAFDPQGLFNPGRMFEDL